MFEFIKNLFTKEKPKELDLSCNTAEVNVFKSLLAGEKISVASYPTGFRLSVYIHNLRSKRKIPIKAVRKPDLSGVVSYSRSINFYYIDTDWINEFNNKRGK